VAKAHSGNENNLIVLYYNARSLLPKMDNLIANCEIYMPDIVCLTESWLCSDISNCEIALPNFSIVRRDRNRNGGGIIVYIRDCFVFRLLPHGPSDLEFLAISVHIMAIEGFVSVYCTAHPLPL